MLSALMMTFLPPEEEADFAEPPEETAGFAVPARVASVWSAAGLAAAAAAFLLTAASRSDTLLWVTFFNSYAISGLAMRIS